MRISDCRGRERALDPLELAVSRHVGAVLL